MYREVSSPVTVVGAGLMGACVARACAARGLDVLILEADDVAAGASGVRAEVLFDPEQATAIEEIAPFLATAMPWFVVGGTASVATDDQAHPQAVSLVPHPNEVGTDLGTAVATVVNTNRLTVQCVRAAQVGGANLVKREFVSSVEETSEGFLLTASSSRVRTKVVVDATGGEGIWGSAQFGVPESATQSVQWLQVDRPSHAVVTHGAPEPQQAWSAAPDLHHTWVFFPHGQPLELDRSLGLSEQLFDLRWRSEEPVEPRAGYFHPAGTHVGQTLARAEEVAESVCAFLDHDESALVMSLPGSSQRVPDEQTLRDRFGIPAWVGRRLLRLYGSEASELLERASSDERTLLCPCESVLACEVRHAVRHEMVASLEDAARRTGVGEGTCAGCRCSRRVSLMLVEAGCLELKASVDHADAFVWDRAQRGKSASEAQREWVALARAYGGH